MAMVSHGAHEIFTEGLRRVGDTRVDNPVWLKGSFAAVRPNDAGQPRKRTRSRAGARTVVMMRGDDNVEKQEGIHKEKRNESHRDEQIEM